MTDCLPLMISLLQAHNKAIRTLTAFSLCITDHLKWWGMRGDEY